MAGGGRLPPSKTPLATISAKNKLVPQSYCFKRSEKKALNRQIYLQNEKQLKYKKQYQPLHYNFPFLKKFHGV